jgi:hypothetical protein
MFKFLLICLPAAGGIAPRSQVLGSCFFLSAARLGDLDR